MVPPAGSSTRGAPPPSQAIIEAVADREGVDVTEIEPPAYEPLYTVVNPEALDRLFENQHDATQRHDGQVTLTYAGYEITVHCSGVVDVIEESATNHSVTDSIEE